MCSCCIRGRCSCCQTASSPPIAVGYPTTAVSHPPTIELGLTGATILFLLLCSYSANPCSANKNDRICKGKNDCRFGQLLEVLVSTDGGEAKTAQ